MVFTCAGLSANTRMFADVGLVLLVYPSPVAMLFLPPSSILICVFLSLFVCPGIEAYHLFRSLRNYLFSYTFVGSNRL